jgi:hypothetical protein
VTSLSGLLSQVLVAFTIELDNERTSRWSPTAAGSLTAADGRAV